VAYVYLLRCADDSLYCGWTTDLHRRVAAHNAGSASRYTRSRLPVELVFSREVGGRAEALREESRIKRLPRAEKLRLIAYAGAGTSGSREIASDISVSENSGSSSVPAR
jgi:putative endonuclease